MVTYSQLSRKLQQAHEAGKIVGIFKNVDRDNDTVNLHFRLKPQRQHIAPTIT